MSLRGLWMARELPGSVVNSMRVLGLIVATLLAERFPQAEAGELALRYNSLVKQESLARFAQSLDLGDFIQLSRSERDSGGGGKPAKLETGAVVRVPLFVSQGEKIKVDTRSGEYMSRVK